MLGSGCYHAHARIHTTHTHARPHTHSVFESRDFETLVLALGYPYPPPSRPRLVSTPYSCPAPCPRTCLCTCPRPRRLDRSSFVLRQTRCMRSPSYREILGRRRRGGGGGGREGKEGCQGVPRTYDSVLAFRCLITMLYTRKYADSQTRNPQTRKRADSVCVWGCRRRETGRRASAITQHD